MCMYGREFGGKQYQRFCPHTHHRSRQVWEDYVCHCLPHTPSHTSHTHSTHLRIHIHTRTHTHTHTHTSHSTHLLTVTHAHAHTTLTIFKVGRQFTPPHTHTPSIDPSTSPTKSLPGGGNVICGIHVAIERRRLCPLSG